MRHRIGIQYGKTQLAQHRADRALPAGDSAGKPQTKHERFYRAMALCAGFVEDNFPEGSPRRSRAAFTVLLISMVMVIGPTPPGTGVSAPATLAASGCTSPTSAEPLALNFSMRAGEFLKSRSASAASGTRFVRPSITAGPGVMQSGAI